MRCLTAPFSLQAQADTVHFLSPGVDGDERADERLGPGGGLRELKMAKVLGPAWGAEAELRASPAALASSSALCLPGY